MTLRNYLSTYHVEIDKVINNNERLRINQTFGIDPHILGEFILVFYVWFLPN